ncbi:MAG: hypothetical protein JNL50_13730, partial [Phycisphaerae bacterium]|nr:hypothetical protein [Phycisphaerae bacterium]
VPEFLSFVLASRGFTTVRTPGSPVISVVKMEAAAGLARVSKDAGDSGGAAFVTQVVKTKHQTPKTLVEAIKGALSKTGGSVAALGESSYLIISDLGPRVDEAMAMLERLDVPDSTVLREVALANISAGSAIATLQSLAGPKNQSGRKLAGDLVAGPDGRSILLVCPPEAEESWRALVTAIDKREATTTQTYTPRFFAARDVSKLVEAVVTGGGPGAGSGASGDRDDRFRVVVDELTGGLIVTATASQHEKIEALMARLDAAERAPTPVKSFPVRNRPVDELLATLQQLIAAGALEAPGEYGSGPARGEARDQVRTGAAQSSYRQPMPTATGDVARGGAGSGNTTSPGGNTGASALSTSGSGDLGPAGNSASSSRGPLLRTGATASGSGSRSGLSLTADRATNAIIAIGEPRMLSQLESLITTLDVRQPQLMLEAMLVSLNDSEALSLGVELEKIGSIENATTKLASLFGLSNGGPATGTVGSAAGFSGVVLNPGEFGVLIRALESINKTRSLSNPKLLVSNNEQAVFSSVLQQPITQQTRTGSNDTTFSYGGSESAGTTISVRPQIARGDHLVLEYTIKLSSFVGSSSAAGLPPPKQENSVDSVATIPDGHVVAVGGLELVTSTEGESRVPLLGEVPLIGELFKSRNNGSGKTRFYVFIKATVLRSTDFEDLKYLSDQASAAMHVDDGFPEVKARVIR